MMACQLLLVLNYYLLPWEARLVKCGLGWILRLDVMFGLSLLFILFSMLQEFIIPLWESWFLSQFQNQHFEVAALYVDDRATEDVSLLIPIIHLLVFTIYFTQP